MPITAADIQRVIVLRVGDVDPATGDPPIAGGAGMVASNIPTLWMLRADKALVAPRLQELYVQRDALDLVIAILRQQVDLTTGDPTLSVKLSQRTTAAQEQRKQTQDEITLLEQRAVAAGGGRVGPITQTEPVSTDDELARRWPIIPDAGDPAYSGSPYRPARWPIGGR